MGERVNIEQPANHLLVLRMMLFRLLPKELNAFLAQGNRHFYRVFLEDEFLWSRQEIRHNLQGADGFVSVFDFVAHKSAYLCASSPPRKSGQDHGGM